MRIVVFGATGAVGREVLGEAMARGHAVTAVLRDPARFTELPEGVPAAVGDARQRADIARLAKGQDLVVTATRPAPGKESELLAAVTAQLAALAATGIRLLVVGGAATLRTPNGATVLEDPDFPAAWRPIALACVEQLAACQAATAVDWTYLSPPALLQPGPRTGKYRSATDQLLIDAHGLSHISTADFAVALLDEAETHRHPRSRYTVGY